MGCGGAAEGGFDVGVGADGAVGERFVAVSSVDGGASGGTDAPDRWQAVGCWEECEGAEEDGGCEMHNAVRLEGLSSCG